MLDYAREEGTKMIKVYIYQNDSNEYFLGTIYCQYVILDKHKIYYFYDENDELIKALKDIFIKVY